MPSCLFFIFLFSSKQLLRRHSSVWRWLSLSALPSLSGSSHRVHETATSPAHWARLHCQELNPQREVAHHQMWCVLILVLGSGGGGLLRTRREWESPFLGDFFFFFWNIALLSNKGRFCGVSWVPHTSFFRFVCSYMSFFLLSSTRAAFHHVLFVFHHLCLFLQCFFS